MTLTKLKKFFESQYAMIAYFLFAWVCWFFKSSNLVVIVSAVFLIAVLLLCSDIKNVFAPLLYVSFFMEDIYVSANWTIYGIAIGFVVASFVYYMIKNIIANRKTIKRGKMFWPFMALTLAFALSGTLYKFSLAEKLIFPGMALFGYLIYFIVINFCHDTKTFFLKLFTLGALVLSVERLVQIFGATDPLDAIIGRSFITLGTQNINAASLFIAIGIPASFGLGYKTNRDYMYFGFSIFFLLSVCITFCRMNIFLSVIAFLIVSVLSFVKSQNKIEYAIVISIFSILMFAFSKPLSIIIGSIVAKFDSGLNGRAELWTWCVDMFKAHPIFGVGFVNDSVVPGLVSPVITAHNTLLQFATSTGIIGTIFAGYFYYKKYYMCFGKSFRHNKFLIFVLIFIALTGTFDQAASMDAFVFVMNASLIASIESGRAEFTLKQSSENLIKRILDSEGIVCNTLRKHESDFGFSNSVYFVDETYVVKIPCDKTKSERLKKEIAFYKNTQLDFVPKYIASGEMDGIDYLVIEKIDGNNLFHIWHSLGEDEQIDAIKQIAEILNKLHSIKGDFLDEKYIQTNWLEKWQKSFDVNIKLLENYGIDATSLKKFREEKVDKLFAKNKNGLVFNDAHFDNFILKDGKVYAIDFDRVLYCPVDYELVVLKEMLEKPQTFTNPFDRKNVRTEDYNFIYGLLKQYCPDMFASKYVEERVAVYRLMLSLSLAYENNDRRLMKHAIEKFFSIVESKEITE